MAVMAEIPCFGDILLDGCMVDQLLDLQQFWQPSFAYFAT